VSACLLGEPVRYDGGSAAVEDPRLQAWRREGRLIAFCPEQLGGLGTPRPPAEIQGGQGGLAVLQGRAQVQTAHGEAVTEAFLAGARSGLALLQAHGVRLAILKEGSPSCGVQQIHDGRFGGGRVAAQGVTTASLRAAGIEVFSERQLDEVEARLRQLT
jgi:uncharacterized protein YbbK (DUF523 family)